MHESDTYLAIFEEGEAIGHRRCIQIIGEERFGTVDEHVMAQLTNLTDNERLVRMLRCAVKAANWQEILETP